MNLIFKENQTEGFYRKLLLLDKVKPCLNIEQKEYIFELDFCWDILLKDRIAPFLCFYYAKEILKKPFPFGEPYIILDSFYSYLYAKHILKGRFLEGEKAILGYSRDAYLYSRQVLGTPWPEAEDIISRNGAVAYDYAVFVLKDRFPLGEPAILNSLYKNDYLEFLRDIGKRHDIGI